MKKMSKKAAIEMSMTTIVVIVLSVTILIFGMIFIKNIMCSGVSIVNGLDEKIQNEVQSLFGTTDYGVKCVGEGGTEQTYGDNGKRHIICIINADQAGTYKFRAMNPTKVGDGGESISTIQNDWVVSDAETIVEVVSGSTPVTVMILDVPKSVSSTSLKIKIDESFKRKGTSEYGDTRTHFSYVNIRHLNQVESLIC